MQAAVAKRIGGGPPAYTLGGWQPGPSFVDWDRTRRAPTPLDLCEAFRSLIFGCAVLNANAVARQTLRLYLGTGYAQARPKASSYLGPKEVSPATKTYLRSMAEFAPYTKGVDHIDEVTEHPLLTIFNEVNPDWDHTRLIRYISICLDVVGRAHVLPGDSDGNIAVGRQLAPFLWPLLAQYVLPYRDSQGSLVSHYYYFSRRYSPEDLISFRGDSLRDPYGLGQSPAQAAFAFVGLQDRYTGAIENILTQSVKPSVIVTNKNPEEPFGDAERRRLQHDINRQLSMGGQGRAWVVDGSIDVKTLNFPPTSLAENEISKTAVEYIAFLFGVPLGFIRNEDSNRATAEADEYKHAKKVVEPRCLNIASTLTTWTHDEGKRRGQDWSRLFWAFDNAVVEDQEREAKIFDMRIKAAVVTINEYRERIGLDAVPWGDMPLQPTTMAPLDEAAASRQLAAQKPQLGLPAPEPAEEEPSEEEPAAVEPTPKKPSRKSLVEQEAVLLERAAVMLARLEADAEESLSGLDVDVLDSIIPTAVNGQFAGNGVGH